MQEALERGYVSAHGSFGDRCERLLEDAIGIPRVMLTTSATAALETAALLLDIQPGDEVIVPSFTFVSTANAFALRGAVPIFADVEEQTFNIDAEQVGALTTERTKAIVPVHYAGVACNLPRITQIADEAGCAVVEDAAHALGASLSDKPLGAWGTLGCLSFHETKNVHCGEGGALLVGDESLIEGAEVILRKGTDRARFDRGQVDRYSWVGLGSSFGLSDLAAAFLLAQLECADRIIRERRIVWERYRDELADWSAEHGVRGPVVPPGAEPSYHLFSLLCPDQAFRDGALAHLRQRGVLATFHYVPLHSSPMGRRIGRSPLGCPITESVAVRLMRLPLYSSMTEDEQAAVIGALKSYR